MTAARRAPAELIDLLLEEIAGAAFIVGKGGRVLGANGRGRAMLEHATTREELEQSIRSGDGRFRVVAAGDRFVAIDRSGDVSFTARLAAASRRWRLTRRQMQVLGELVYGRSNREIADALGIADSTVEIHVAAVTAKAHVGSRAEVIARFWMQT